jgi:amino acid adenylation domain-containing protein
LRLETYLQRTAERHPARTALICGDVRLSYRSIDESARRLADALIGIGVRRGDRVAVHLDNCVETVIAVYAILHAGAIFVLINWSVKPEKLAFMLDDCGAVTLITRAQKAAALPSVAAGGGKLASIILTDREERRTIGMPTHAWAELMGNAIPAGHGEPRGIDLDLAALIYTSGSSGRPKGVMLTHGNMAAAATSVISYLENDESDVIACALPLSFSYGLHQMLTAFQVGATLLLERSFAYPHQVLQRMADERATGLALVPTMAALLLQLDTGSYDLACLRYLTNAGAALSPSRALALQRAFPKARLFLMYGLTECKRVCFLPPDELVRRPDSVGRPMADVEAYVVDEHCRPLPAGEVGELVVRGANVMRGYWNLPDETERALRPGPVPGERVLHTGDLFRKDGDGFLYFVGRRDDIIKTRGEKVSPTEVENVLYRLEGIALAAVFGVSDPLLGSAVKAVVTLADDAHLTETDIRRHCARYLDDFMVPRFVEIRSSLPRNEAGKIDKRRMLLGEE